MATFHKLKIASISRETSKAVKVSFDVPEHLKADFSFKAGQYITLKTEINNETVRRDYSLCTNPESRTIAVAIKEVEGGTFSVFANKSITSGDEIEVSTPNGRFIYNPNTSSETIFGIAAGSGITPVMGIAKTVLKETTNSKFVLLFGNKSEQDTIFKNELTTLTNEFSDRFSVQHVFSQEQKEYALSGRINEAVINATHEKLNQNQEEEEKRNRIRKLLAESDSEDIGQLFDDNFIGSRHLLLQEKREAEEGEAGWWLAGPPPRQGEGCWSACCGSPGRCACCGSRGRCA